MYDQSQKNRLKLLCRKKKVKFKSRLYSQVKVKNVEYYGNHFLDFQLFHRILEYRLKVLT